MEVGVKAFGWTSSRTNLMSTILAPFEHARHLANRSIVVADIAVVVGRLVAPHHVCARAQQIARSDALRAACRTLGGNVPPIQTFNNGGLSCAHRGLYGA